MRDLITNNFKTSEVIHTDFNSFPAELAPCAYAAQGAIQSLRDALGIPITINSGYRSPGYNAAIGGVPTSHHIWRLEPDGRMVWALDITSPGLSAEMLFKKVKPLVIGETYLHTKLQFVHISPQKVDEEWIA
jgi:uncharacterized protein YcbK (DUF882 family)